MSVKRLRSVVHSTAQHAVSGLCCVHPHLGKACAASRIQSVSIDLIRAGFEPKLVEVTKELKLSCEALRGKFRGILLSEALDLAALLTASATFQFRGSHWPIGCHVATTTLDGTNVSATVDIAGNPAEAFGGPN